MTEKPLHEMDARIKMVEIFLSRPTHAKASLKTSTLGCND